MSQIQFSHINTDDAQYIVVFIPGRGLQPPVGSDHPNFTTIAAACAASMKGESVDTDTLIGLFDVGATVNAKFKQLTERVAVKGGEILLDGDPVDGTLQDQILDFVAAGEDFTPLVNFYEKLLTNPLGNVQDGLYDWIKGQRAEGSLTITPEGDLIGYKAVCSHVKADGTTVYRPSRRGAGVVNGVDVPATEYIEQVPGDVVEMPRSKVLNAPSRACGDGLHIGTWAYAKDFTGDTVMLVQFSPRDIVSLPDSNSTWKLRVCRYKVIGPVTEALDVPLYLTEDNKAAQEKAAQQGVDLALDGVVRDANGRWVAGRPGSKRDSSGRFSG